MVLFILFWGSVLGGVSQALTVAGQVAGQVGTAALQTTRALGQAGLAFVGQPVFQQLAGQAAGLGANLLTAKLMGDRGTPALSGAGGPMAGAPMVAQPVGSGAPTMSSFDRFAQERLFGGGASFLPARSAPTEGDVMMGTGSFLGDLRARAGEVIAGSQPGQVVAEGLWRQTPSRYRPRTLIAAENPVTGEPTFWRHVGRPVLFSGDMSTARRVKRIGSRVHREFGRRPR